jgi:hypothetical protein
MAEKKKECGCSAYRGETLRRKLHLRMPYKFAGEAFYFFLVVKAF